MSDQIFGVTSADAALVYQKSNRAIADDLACQSHSNLFEDF